MQKSDDSASTRCASAFHTASRAAACQQFQHDSEVCMASGQKYGWRLAALFACGLIDSATCPINAQAMPKPQVASLIAKVENGVDEFRDYLKRRGDNARSASSTGPAQSRRVKRGGASDSQKATGEAKKDELEEALDDL